MIGAIVAAPPPHPDILPPRQPAAKPSAPVDPWALRTADELAATANPWHPLWTQLFHEWAAQRARNGRRTTAAAVCVPTAVPHSRTPRDALFDLLSVYDVWRLDADQYMRLAVPSALPSPRDISINVVLIGDGSVAHDVELVLPRAGVDLALLAAQGIDQFRVVVQLVDAGRIVVRERFDIDTASGTVERVPDADADDAGPDAILYARWFQGAEYASPEPAVWGSPDLAAARCAFRVYGSTIDDVVPTRPAVGAVDVEPLIAPRYMFGRVIPVTDTRRPQPPPLVARNQQLTLATVTHGGTSSAGTMEATLVAQFTLSTNSMQFDVAASSLRGPGSAPAAFFVYENEQWTRQQAPVVCTETQPRPALPAAPLDAPLPPASSQRQRFGHVHGAAPPAQPVPVSLADERNYFEPVPMRGRYARRPAWLGFWVDNLHPHATFVEETSRVSMAILDPDGVLRDSRVHSVRVRLCLQWRATPATPFATVELPLLFQLAYGERATYAYAGMPDVCERARRLMPCVVRRGDGQAV